MRLPLLKLHRAFPELDRFSDAQCRGMIHRVVMQRPGMMIVASVLALAAWMLVTGAICGAAVMFSRIPLARRHDLEVVALGLLLGIGCGTVVALLVRDVFVRAMVREWVNSSRCVKCRYSLLGLQTRGSQVQCPECGMSNDLEARGIDPQTLVPRS